MEENKLIYKFSHTDEFGQVCNYERELSLANIEVENSFDLMIEQFKCFLMAQGYSQNTVDKIQVED